MQPTLPAGVQKHTEEKKDGKLQSEKGFLLGFPFTVLSKTTLLLWEELRQRHADFVVARHIPIGLNKKKKNVLPHGKEKSVGGGRGPLNELYT